METIFIEFLIFSWRPLISLDTLIAWNVNDFIRLADENMLNGLEKPKQIFGRQFHRPWQSGPAQRKRIDEFHQAIWATHPSKYD